MKSLFPGWLRGPVAADLHRLRFAPLLETSPPRHPYPSAIQFLSVYNANV